MQTPKLLAPTAKNSISDSGKIRAGIIFLLLLGISLLGFWITRGQGPGAAENQGVNLKQAIPVVVAKPIRQVFEHRVATQGNIEAKYTALVSPRIPGTLEKIFVDEGDGVVAGKTRLFAIDSVKLEQNAMIQEHALAIARCGHQQALANLEKVKADLDKARLDFKRFERLLKNHNTTQDAFELQQSRYLQVSAVYKLAQAQAALAAEQVRQAEAALAIAKKDLADTTVLAPISGRISRRFKEPGEMGSSGQPVVQIVDTSLLEVSAFLPSTLYALVTPGQTPLEVTVSGTALNLQTISYKSPAIEPKLRTFEIKALLTDVSKDVAPGSMAEVTAILEHREQWGVPAEAVLTRGGKSVLFTLDAAGLARQHSVHTGFESNGRVEILDKDVSGEWLVVVMGQAQLDDGSPVTVKKEEN
ncbi:MAG: efflux RND transporter periplasmic adaptor subunit [Proteobacteria bacterium]|nr:efflux RND transporter periplasmic adaptor subunit [Pseudomonadota bacterium]MBU4054150.1 efflux RND transporter periplasmic adaptor subunit [Pseudomonadota bacterium]